MTDRSKTTLRRLRCALAAAVLATGSAMAPSALADDRLALTVLAFVHSIDASPYWSAEIRGLAIDDERATVTIGSLVVAAERGGIAVDINNATLTGYAETIDGGFTASSLEIERVAIATAGTKAEFKDLRFSQVGVPPLAGVAYDRSKPFSSLIAAFSAIAKSRSAGGQIAEISIRDTNQGQTSLITYANVALSAVADGELESASAGPLTLQSPASNPLANLSVARVEARGIDLDAFVHVFDPLRYIAGTGDEKWRRAVGQLRYDDIELNVPSIRLKIGEISINDVEVRQPVDSFAPLIDALTSARWPTPLAMKRLRSDYLGKFLSTFGVGRFAVDGVVVSATGIDQLTLGGLELKDASTDGFGEVAIQDFVAAIAGQGAAQVGRLALGKVVPPPIETVDHALEQAQRGRDVDVSSLVPKLGWVEAADIHLQAIDFAGLALGRLRAGFDNHVGTVPTAVAVNVEDLDLATASLPNESLRSLIAGLGYERIGVDADLSLKWHEADGTLSLDEFELDIADFGHTTADLVLAGLTREAIEQGDDAALDELRFERARVTFEDRSVVDRSLSMRADVLNIPLDRLKQQVSGALPLMLAVLGEQAKAIVPVLQDFIKSPGTLTIEAAPETPVPVADIANAVRRPQSLPSLLSISVSGTPGDEADAGDEVDTGDSGRADNNAE